MSESSITTSLSAADLQGDAIQPGHPLFGLIWINPDRMSGVPCFTGTRVPVRTLFDYIEAGDPLDEFLAGFPSVSREQATGVLNLAEELLEKLGAP